MKIEKLQGSEVSFEILKDGEEYKNIKNEVLAKFKNVKVDGFRKGHVPLDVIEKTFENDIRDEIINEVLKKEYATVLKEEKIRPVSDLQIVELKYEKDSLKLVLKVAVFPEFEMPQYKGLGIEEEKVEVTDEEVTAELNMLAQRSKKFEKVEREAKLGDIAIINFEGFVNGEAFNGGKAEDYRLELGSKTFIDNFEEQIVGHKIGDEFEVNVKFPEAYHSEELKGKDAMFKVKLNSLEEAILPELNDDFAKANGADTLEDLKNTLKGRILSTKENNAKSAKLNKIMTTLEENTTMEVPTIVVENEINAQLNNFANQLQMQGMNLDSYLQMTGMTVENMRNDLRERAEKGVKTSFILSRIAENENILVSEEEVENEFNNVAAMYGMDGAKLREELEKTNGVDRFYNQILSQLLNGKINDFLLENN